MANERKIIVEIITTQARDSTITQQGSVEETKTTNTQAIQNNSSKAIAMMAVKRLGSTIINSAEVSLNRYFSMSENYIAENDYQNTISVIKKIGSFGSSVLTSTMAGSNFGPGGAAVGAIIGASTWVGNEYINYQQRMSNYYQNLNATNYQTEFDRTRLGLTNEGKGTEN